jgi:hypothetical protein
MTSRRRLIWVAGIATVLASGCARQATTVYTGTYTRTWVDADGEGQQQSGPVTLELGANGRYRVAGEAIDLPPARAGQFVRHRDELILVDTAPATAGYSLNLILSGTLQLAEDGETLILSQENIWGHSHLLILERNAGP